jgi:hypothetical protein
VSDGTTVEVTVERQIKPEMKYLTGNQVAGKLAGDSASKASPRKTRAASAR